MKYPDYRLRRLRKKNGLRQLLREHSLSSLDLIMPYFIIEGENVCSPIKTMPGMNSLSVDKLLKEIPKLIELNIPAILLFGIPEQKDATGSKAIDKNSIVPRAIAAITEHFPQIVIITDICLCSYTDHGHCGIIIEDKIDNDLSLPLLADMVLSHAQAGADIVAPSAMMDGQVHAIRRILDKHNFGDVAIMSYSAKYASNFYGPFREAANSAPQFGDRKSYQMDYANAQEALREIQADIEEGADIVMVKPALSYLDIIYRAKQAFNYPLAAYNVSGEYSLIKSAVAQNLVKEKEIILEILTSIKRAGADMIISYHAREIAQFLKEKNDF